MGALFPADDVRDYVRRCEQLSTAIVFNKYQGKLVLVVDADAEMRSLLSDCLDELGLRVATAGDRHDALHQITCRTPHVVLIELQLPPGGFDYVKQLQARWPSCPIILMTAFGTHEANAGAMACGVPLLTKPIKLKDLQRAALGVLDGQWAPRQRVRSDSGGSL